MLNDSLTPVSWRSRPQSFVALMSLYESNFIRLGWLVGELASLSGEHRSRTRHECELVLSVLDNSRYTTTLNLTYLLPRRAATTRGDATPGVAPGIPLSGDYERLPDVQVRVYRDAHLAEAQEWGVPERASTVAPVRGRALPERELGRRWQRNMMLNKWLEYCVERGHRFHPPG